MAKSRISGMTFGLVIAGSATGKTIAVRALAGLSSSGIYLDTNDAGRIESLGSVLHAARRAHLWSVHNAVWHPMILGAISAVIEQRNRTGPPATTATVFDHTGWFVEDLCIWGRVSHVVYVIPDTAAARAERFLARRGDQDPGALGFHSKQGVERMMTGQDDAARALLQRVPRTVPVLQVAIRAMWDLNKKFLTAIVGHSSAPSEAQRVPRRGHDGASEFPMARATGCTQTPTSEGANPGDGSERSGKEVL